MASHRTRLLETRLPVDGVYYDIARDEIHADDARLALKYPGIWQRHFESIEYVAVSIVGFNLEKTEAIVYARTRGSDGLHFLTLVDGQCVVPKLPFGCAGGVA